MLTVTDLLDRLAAGPVACTGLANVRLPDGTVHDLRIEADRVVEVLLPQTISGDGLDLDGYLVLPAGADAHAHLDKALSLSGVGGANLVPAYGDLHHAIEQWRTFSENADEADYHRRATAAALELLANGVTAIRSHCNLNDGDDPFLGLRALVRVRNELKPLLDIEIAVLPAPWSPTADIAGAMDRGADIMGGCPHLAEDPEAELDRLVELARQYRVGIDIHADEQLTPTMLSVRSLARHAAAQPFDGTVTAGHCVSLGMLPEPELSVVVAELAAAGVGVVSLPITNLYLQGWDDPVAMPRGLTAVRALLDGGVVLAGGGDNIRDPFNPVGRADPLETAALLVVAGHLTMEEAVDAATTGGRAVMGLDPAGAFAGGVADLLLVKGSSLGDVVARAPADRVVLHAGRVVSASRTRQAVAAR